jgi:hypothetical protein
MMKTRWYDGENKMGGRETTIAGWQNNDDTMVNQRRYDDENVMAR